MREKHLLRHEAPFEDKVWEMIDQAVLDAARSELSARKILYIEGPFGLGLKSIDGTDRTLEGGSEGSKASLRVSDARSLALIRSDFRLPVRDVAYFEQTGLSFNLKAAAQAGIASARQEDALIFHGRTELGLEGLLTAKGIQSLELQSWEDIGKAAEDVIKATTKLDEGGFHGPYSLALSPGRYNLLFRLYPHGNLTELEHLKSIVTEGVVKAPVLSEGGVLIASGKQFAGIVVGQDMMAGFIGPDDGDYQLSVSESLVLRLLQPGAVCALRGRSIESI